MDDNYNNLFNIFYQKFGTEPLLVDAPGRINIIGEHTDYNDGFVLPAAIDKSVKIAIQKNNSATVQLIAIDLYEEYSFSIDEILTPIEKQWANYFLGVISELKLRGAALGGFNLMFTSDIPIGSGLSSSAAIECGFGVALCELFKVDISRQELALIGQAAEHKFTGVKCGIMDQFASIMGKENQVIQLDCRSLEFSYFPADFDEYQIVLFDTQVKHNLAESEYNVRREQCEMAVKAVQLKYPKVTALRDITRGQIEEVKEALGLEICNRATYVIEENERVKLACELLQVNKIKDVGDLMFATHQGLSNLYEVSCKELDLLVSTASKIDAIIGARMMGGGFGGCTINLIKKSEVNQVVEFIENEYYATIGVKLKVYRVSISDGVRVIK
jgi:galactokinase